MARSDNPREPPAANYNQGEEPAVDGDGLKKENKRKKKKWLYFPLVFQRIAVARLHVGRSNKSCLRFIVNQVGKRFLKMAQVHWLCLFNADRSFKLYSILWNLALKRPLTNKTPILIMYMTFVVKEKFTTKWIKSDYN